MEPVLDRRSDAARRGRILRPHEDATGRALLDHLEGAVDVSSVIERDDGWVEDDAVSQYFTPPRDWFPHHREAVRFARGRVLDIGCGAGRVARYLQQRGHEVVGIDNSPLAVEVSSRLGLRDVRLAAATGVSRPALGTFGTFVLLCNGLGLLSDARRARWMLRRLRAMAEPGARIIGDGTDPAHTNEPAHLAYHERNRRRGRLPGQLRLRVRYRDLATPWFDYLFLSRCDLEALIRGTGWEAWRYVEGPGGTYTAVLFAT